MSNEELKKSHSIHPYVWKYVQKMYDYCYGSDDKVIMAVLTSLKLEFDLNKKSLNLISFFIELSIDDAFKILKDILEIPDFWPDSNDLINQRNYRNNFTDRLNMSSFVSPFSRIGSIWTSEPVIEPHKLWGSQLVDLLKQKNGISYNRDTQEFTYSGIENIVVIPVRNIPRSTALINPIIHNEEIYKDPFYEKLVKEINSSFYTGQYTAAVVLSRKLIENLIIEVLKIKYPISVPAHLELYYKKDQHRYKDFSELVDILNNKKNEFIGEENTISRFISKVNHFRERANSTAHTLTIIPNEEEVLQYDIQYMLDLILRLMKIARHNKLH